MQDASQALEHACFHFLTPSSFYRYNLPDIFQKSLQKYYGDQTASLNKILACKDRTCELLLKDSKPAGVLVYKDELQAELKNPQLADYLEIKSLFIISPESHPRQRLGSYLLMRACEVALEKGANSILVTVSSGCKTSLAFFLHYGFTCIESYPDLYTKGLLEHFLMLTDIPRLHAELSTLLERPRCLV